jgi:hypothetical protein
MQVLDAGTMQVIGYLLDISPNGIRVDSGKPLQVNTMYRLRLDLVPELAHKTYMIFNGRSAWCEADKFEPNTFNIGFELDGLSREDTAIFQRMYDQYGVDIRQ